MELNEPYLFGNEINYLKKCIDNNKLTYGSYINKFENIVKKYLGIKFAIATVNCTSSLHIGLKLLGAEKNTEVITTTITFIASINSIIYNNSSPIFMDVDDNLNIDTAKTIEFIKYHTFYKNGYSYNKLTRKKIVALMIVHTFGNAVFLDELVSVCKKRNILIIEDCAESLGTKYIKGKFKNKHTGTIGKISCLSFNGNKIITSAGGGMILTNDKMKAKKARYLINQAKDNSFKFIHNQIGYNYRLSNIHAAIGFAQFEKLPVFLKRKNNIQKLYLRYLKGIEGIKIINTSNYSKNNYWLNVICIDKKKFNKNSTYLLKKLNNKNIKARPIWFPNHLQKKFKNYQSFKINNANKIYSNCICLPSSISLADQDIYKICNIIHE